MERSRAEIIDATTGESVYLHRYITDHKYVSLYQALPLDSQIPVPQIPVLQGCSNVLFKVIFSSCVPVDDERTDPGIPSGKMDYDRVRFDTLRVVRELRVC